MNRSNRWRRGAFRRWSSWCIALLAASVAGFAAARGAAAQATDDDEPKIRKPEAVSLVTRDGVRLAATYYPAGTTKKTNKEAVPVVLLHSWKGSQAEFAALAPRLQGLGHAVLVPDLRGHGRSTSRQVGQNTEELKADKLLQRDFVAMAQFDVLALKDFLWERNNAEELNLNKLCLVGSEMGATVALYWALLDARGYDQGQPTYGALQLGRFVKAVVLLSPEWVFKGLPSKTPIDFPAVRSEIPLLILVGAGGSRNVRDAEQIHRILEPYHKFDDKGLDAKQKLAKTTLFLGKLDTALQGSKILEARQLRTPPEAHIIRFIELRLIEAPEAAAWKWKALSRPHGG